MVKFTKNCLLPYLVPSVLVSVRFQKRPTVHEEELNALLRPQLIESTE